MPNFVSNGGKWFPAKEEVGLVNLSEKTIKYKGNDILPGKPFIYEGPDRESVRMLAEAGSDHLGNDFRTDPEFLQAVRNMGYNAVDEYLKAIGYDEKKAEEEFKEKASVIKAHEIPKRNKEIFIMGGGKDFVDGTQSTIGGFGDERVRSKEELIKK